MWRPGDSFYRIKADGRNKLELAMGIGTYLDSCSDSFGDIIGTYFSKFFWMKGIKHESNA